MSTTAVASTLSKLPTALDPAFKNELEKITGFDREVKKTLGQSDFLKLLSAQLANQDPLEPQKDTEFVAQMSTFSSVQQMSDLVTSLKSFIATQDFASAQGFLGKWVTVDDGKNLTSGYVTNVGTDDSKNAVLTVNGKTYTTSQIAGVKLRDPAEVVTATGG